MDLELLTQGLLHRFGANAPNTTQACDSKSNDTNAGNQNGLDNKSYCDWQPLESSVKHIHRSIEMSKAQDDCEIENRTQHRYRDCYQHPKLFSKHLIKRTTLIAMYDFLSPTGLEMLYIALAGTNNNGRGNGSDEYHRCDAARERCDML
mmetsp:Transcript_49573/g.91715  ORF Transcript_49573/g.91715 Transcript_49573/m.91715 type:complete len:149 (-) Transcript_49573:118-564(-)